jgi:hypothetical protein
LVEIGLRGHPEGFELEPTGNRLFVNVPGTRINHIPTAIGARTAFYDPDMDRFFLAVNAAHGLAAAIWVYKPEESEPAPLHLIPLMALSGHGD